jgi:tetratricopeptide (TPR) repeat protein
MSLSVHNPARCPRCGHQPGAADKFCAECGRFLRDASVDQRLLLALVHEREGRGAEARQELQHLLDAEPGHVLANHLLGNLVFHEGLLDLAIEHYRRAVAVSVTFDLAYYDLGVAYYHRGNMPEAATAFRRCLEINPDYNAAHYRLALALFHQGQLADAREHFELSATLTPEYVMAHYHLGVIHEREGAPEVARREFERSLEEGVHELSSLFHLAVICRAQGDNAGADELLRRAGEFGKVRPAASDTRK